MFREIIYKLQKSLEMCSLLMYTSCCEFTYTIAELDSGVKIMANIKSAKKRIKVIDKKTAQNRRIKENLKKILKDYNQTLASGDLEAAAEKRTLAEKALKKAASRHTISKQAASRKVSQITRKLNAAKAAE